MFDWAKLHLVLFVGCMLLTTSAALWTICSGVRLVLFWHLCFGRDKLCVCVCVCVCMVLAYVCLAIVYVVWGSLLCSCLAVLIVCVCGCRPGVAKSFVHFVGFGGLTSDQVHAGIEGDASTRLCALHHLLCAENAMRATYAVSHHLLCARSNTVKLLVHRLPNSAQRAGALQAGVVIPLPYQPAVLVLCLPPVLRLLPTPDRFVCLWLGEGVQHK